MLLFPPVREESLIFLWFTVTKGLRRTLRSAEKLLLTDRLLEAVLAEAQVVCGGQPLLIAGDF